VPGCVAPPDLTRLDLPLTRTARRLAAHRLAMIVALGSSSTAGAGASSAEATYPSRLMAELARRLPTQSIIVLNRGISGERAVDMLARFDDSVRLRLDRTSTFGYEATREAAMAAFAESWRRE
jgi:acyl-CoA thioesterase I